VGKGDVVVIDPGPILEAHQSALENALRGERVVGIVATHCHGDHSPLAQWMKETYGAPTYAFGPHPHYEVVADDDDDDEKDVVDTSGKETDVREHVDTAFVPDVLVKDSEKFLTVGNWSLTGVHTPGHTSNHLCIALDAEEALFTGDHIMGWSTTVVTPPDGDMRDYFASVRKLQARNDKVLWPTHGNPITDPQPFLRAYLEHREEREAQVLEQVRAGVSTIKKMVEVLYADVHQQLHKAAGRSVYAHLIKLSEDGLVAVADGKAPAKKSAYLPK
jgi:glyoxylase-like metal-dependent hydrolase (beta-lactamase superfamily II)